MLADLTLNRAIALPPNSDVWLLVRDLIRFRAKVKDVETSGILLLEVHPDDYDGLVREKHPLPINVAIIKEPKNGWRFTNHPSAIPTKDLFLQRSNLHVYEGTTQHPWRKYSSMVTELKRYQKGLDESIRQIENLPHVSTTLQHPN